MEQALAQTGDFLRTVVRHLHVTEFDQLRMASTTCRDLCLPLERQVLRLSFNRLSIAGEWTRLAMRDIMLPNQWSTLRNLVGWVADGWAGESIDALFQRLAEVQQVLLHRDCLATLCTLPNQVVTPAIEQIQSIGQTNLELIIPYLDLDIFLLHQRNHLIKPDT